MRRHHMTGPEGALALMVLPGVQGASRGMMLMIGRMLRACSEVLEVPPPHTHNGVRT